MYKPHPTEYDAYYSKYVSLVPENDIRQAYADQPAELRRTFDGQEESVGLFAYEPGKWTVKEVLSHIIDGERVFAYRMHRISRGDETPIEGFEQDGYIENSNANDRPFENLLREFELARAANVLMLNNMDEAALSRMGTASGLPVSVRALANISIGHVRHHLAILNERYLA
ncbi:MAG: DinB family protein [Chloracidobacterium sp.]|nr:DinB family protein [Chloracidobacterium sp.]